MRSKKSFIEEKKIKEKFRIAKTIFLPKRKLQTNESNSCVSLYVYWEKGNNILSNISKILFTHFFIKVQDSQSSG